MDKAGNLTLFDFDDCTYTWFIDDIALALFYAMPVGQGEAEAQTFARTFLTPFLHAYFKEHVLVLAWFEEIPHFMKARELAVYAALLAHTEGDLSALDGWSARFMAGRGERIAARRPCLALDFADVASERLKA
jgi:Ser/Thr protein kinase RdoA (MazF antagonist)